MTEPIPALPEVEAYRDRILAYIDSAERASAYGERPYLAADRRRVERDVEGLRDCEADRVDGLALWNAVLDRVAQRYWTDLTEVGADYGQPWEVQP